MSLGWRNLGLAVALAVLTVAVLWPGVWGGFIFDDYPNLLADNSWRMVHLGWAEVMRALQGGISSASGRPLAMLSFALNHYFFGTSPWWFKLMGLLWHALNAVLLWQVLRQCLLLAGQSARIGTAAVAAMAAVLWALHPLQVSTVFYVVQRMEMGAATAVLLALWCYLNARRAVINARPARAWTAATALAVLLGLGFKETVLLVPVYALLLEVCLLGFRGRSGRPWPLLKIAYGVGLGVAVLAFVLLVVPQYGAVQRYPGRDFGTQVRLLSQGPVLWMYLTQAVTAWPELLRFYYDDWAASMAAARWWQVALPWAGLACLIGVALYVRRRSPLFALGVGWFFAGHLLTSNIWPLELAFEHRNYFPLAGLVLSASAVALALGRRLTVGAGPAMALVVLVYVGTMGGLQAAAWGNADSLALTLANRAPDSERAGYALGQWMYAKSAGDLNDPLRSMAEAEMQRIAALPLSSGLPEQAMVVMAGHAGQHVPAELWARLRVKVERRELDAQTLSAVEGIAECASSGQCRFSDVAEVQGLLLAALESSPQSDRLHARYGEFALSRMGDQDLAIRLFERAIELAPSELVYRILLARTLLMRSAGNDVAEAKRLAAWVQAHDLNGEHTEEVSRLQAVFDSHRGDSK